MSIILQETYELMAREAISLYGTQGAVIDLLKERDQLRSLNANLLAACELMFVDVLEDEDGTRNIDLGAFLDAFNAARRQMRAAISKAKAAAPESEATR